MPWLDNLLDRRVLDLVLIGCSTVLFLILYVSMRIGIAKREHLLTSHLDELRNRVAELGKDVEAYRISDQRVSVTATTAPDTAVSVINLTKRGQALRLHRNGSGTEAIAQSLQMSRGEVELLIKVSEMQCEPVAS
jgi:hypothetical protein